MNNILETFEIETKPHNNFVCRLDPLLFTFTILIIVIFLYIIQFKIVKSS